MTNDKKEPKNTGRHERRISIRSVRRDDPDERKLARALIAIVRAQAEAEAQAEHARLREQSSKDVA